MLYPTSDLLKSAETIDSNGYHQQMIEKQPELKNRHDRQHLNGKKNRNSFPENRKIIKLCWNPHNQCSTQLDFSLVPAAPNLLNVPSMENV